jgi:branched-chain amino acid transport system permease protein
MIRSLLPWLAGALVCLVISAGIYPALNPYYQTIYMISGIFIILSVSLNLINGFTGQFSLGHAGFMAVGGYTSAAITYYFLPQWQTWLSGMGMGAELSEQILFFLSLLAGAATAAISGILVGLPSLRLKGDYLAIVTLGFGEIIRVLLLNIETLGGARGLTGIKLFSTANWMTGMAFLATFTVARLLGSAPGRAHV